MSHMDQRMTDLDSNRIDELAALLAVACEGAFVAAGRSLQRHATIISECSAHRRPISNGMEYQSKRVNSHRITVWRFRLSHRFRNGVCLIASLPPPSSRKGRCCRTIALLLDAARQGIGILGAGEWLMARDFAQGTLVPVLPAWSFDAAGGIYLVRLRRNSRPRARRPSSIGSSSCSVMAHRGRNGLSAAAA